MTGVGKVGPAVVTGRIVGVKQEQTTTPGATTRRVLVPYLQQSETGSAVGVTFLTGEPVGVVGTVYVWVSFSVIPGVVFGTKVLPGTLGPLAGVGLPVGPGKARDGATGNEVWLSC